MGTGAIAVHPKGIEKRTPRRKRRLRNRQMVLPARQERRGLTLNINTSVDTNLKVYSLVVGKMKNQIVLETLENFLANPRASCDPVDRMPEAAKVRVTFILTKDLEKRLDSFVEEHSCNYACAVTNALLDFFKKHKIDALKTPSKTKLLEALRA